MCYIYFMENPEYMNGLNLYNSIIIVILSLYCLYEYGYINEEEEEKVSGIFTAPEYNHNPYNSQQMYRPIYRRRVSASNVSQQYWDTTYHELIRHIKHEHKSWISQEWVQKILLSDGFPYAMWFSMKNRIDNTPGMESIMRHHRGCTYHFWTYRGHDYEPRYGAGFQGSGDYW
eukprot:UN34406